MTFVAQFSFSDSTDLFDSLPGDILLLFADGAYRKDWHPQDVGALRFEWLNHSESGLVEEADIPPARWDLFPVYGEIHRTKDYLTGGMWESAWWSIMLKRSRSPREFFSGLFAQGALEKVCHKSWNVSVIQGTKIGGLPSWIQNAEEIPGRFLCALGSIHPAYQTRADDAIARPYPFTNHQAPLVPHVRRDSGGRQSIYRTKEEETQSDRLLMWDDVGSLYLFLDGNGVINWTIQCYYLNRN